MEVRACGHARELYRQTTYISVYLGDPADGVALARKTLPAIDGEDGTCTWFVWTPKEVGNYDLTAVLEEPRGDVLTTNNRVVLEAEVLSR